MSEDNLNLSELQRDLKDLAKRGICADRQKLKEDMCSQFSDYREYIRELVVNSYDAKARHCWISGYEDVINTYITAYDDGHGMDRKGIIIFNTVFRSDKKGDPLIVVGCHGVGKTSIAAIPGQCGFSMMTSTGSECWRMKTGNLLDDKPIKLEQVRPVPPQGTCIEITFKKTNSIEKELNKLANVLKRYLKYLPIKIGVFILEGDDPTSPKSARILETIHGQWSTQTERFARFYSFRLEGNKYDVVLGLGPGTHEIYQNLVFVSDRYNLLFYDLPSQIKVPHLKIRVNSSGFDLPFGRHCLRNEDILGPLAKYLRENILLQYLGELFTFYMEGYNRELNVSPMEVEDLACALIEYDAGPERIWSRLPIFFLCNHSQRVSLLELKKISSEKGMLYLESDKNIGADYSIFDAPVLALKQPERGLELLQGLFKNKIVNLSKDDIVLEAPAGTAPELEPIENHFKKSLGFHPEILRRIEKHFERDDSKSESDGFGLISDDIDLLKGLSQESLRAREDLASIQWRVNYLVQRDGKSKCVTSQFLFKNNAIILNLNNPDVQDLVRLSEIAPVLAGHYALAMCLLDGGVLSYFTPEALEDLIQMDAMIRCGTKNFLENMKVVEPVKVSDSHWQDFLRNIDDRRRWRN